MSRDDEGRVHGRFVDPDGASIAGAGVGLVDDGIGAVTEAIIGGLIGVFAYGFEGPTAADEPKENPAGFDIFVGPANQYPTLEQWGSY